MIDAKSKSVRTKRASPMKPVQQYKGKFRRLLDSFNLLLLQYNHLHIGSGRKIGIKGQIDRKRVGRQMLDDLYNALGFKISDVHGLKGRHVSALCNMWKEQGLKPGTIANRVSVLRAICHWIGKPQIIGSIKEYFKDESVYRRSGVAKESKSWKDCGVDFDAVMQEVIKIEPRVVIHFELQKVLGLRVEESMKIRPHEADLGHCLALRHGTKGGRYREVQIVTEEQRRVVDKAKAIAKNRWSSLIPDKSAYDKWRRRYNYVCKEVGITRKGLGVTSHGLRHEYSIDKYEDLSGEVAPVRQKEEQTSKSGEVNKDRIQHAKREVSSDLGHARIQITGAYIGSTHKPKKS